MSGVEKSWLDHLAAIDAEGISTKAYAERERLSVSALYEQRRRLHERRQQASVAVASSFVAVQVRPERETTRCQLMIGTDLRLEFSQLPSVDWLAALACAVARKVVR